MVDLFAIMLVTGACLYVTIRAVMLDRMLPWFTARTTREPEQEEPSLPAPEVVPAVAAAGWRSRTTGPKIRPGQQMDR